MSGARVFVARLVGCDVFDPVGDRVGRVRDVVVVQRAQNSPVVIGLVVEVPGRRRVFASIGRIETIANGQVFTTGLLNTHKFEQRAGEIRIIAEFLGRKFSFNDGSGEATVEDVAIAETGPGEWEISQLFVRRPRVASAPLTKGATSLVDWSEVRAKQTTGESQSAEALIATYYDLKPADLATSLLDLPEERRLEVAEELPDDRLADALEEMAESDQVDLISHLESERAADILDEMDPDDAADLIAQLPKAQGEELLDLMEPEEAEDVRMLLSFGADTAGGLMTPEPIILSAEATVAEALAHIRRHELDPTIAAAVCVTLPPFEAPTGKYLGLVHFQRLLRYPPHEKIGSLLDDGTEPINVNTSAAVVSRILASYNLVSVPVVDDNNRLVGVVTIDDVLDYLLPDDWRSYDDGDAVKPSVEKTAAAKRRTQGSTSSSRAGLAAGTKRPMTQSASASASERRKANGTQA